MYICKSVNFPQTFDQKYSIFKKVKLLSAIISKGKHYSLHLATCWWSPVQYQLRSWNLWCFLASPPELWTHRRTCILPPPLSENIKTVLLFLSPHKYNEVTVWFFLNDLGQGCTIPSQVFPRSWWAVWFTSFVLLSCKVKTVWHISNLDSSLYPAWQRFLLIENTSIKTTDYLSMHAAKDLSTHAESGCMSQTQHLLFPTHGKSTIWNHSIQSFNHL